MVRKLPQSLKKETCQFLDLNFTQIKIKLRYFVSIQEKPQIAILNLHEF